MAELYLAYLRKSRKDAEAEAQGAGETLARHRKILSELAERGNFNVVRTFEEVVSGDSIADRPEMQKLLKEVETGLYAGVLVVEVERLSRGDGIDQAIVSRTFQYTNTKIITPTKIYDPNNEMDSEYFEFGLFMSRREYNTIKRRLQRGKEMAAKEGKWSNGFAPYGYQKVKLQGQKGMTLEPSDKADIVRMIYELFVGGESCGKISTRLNEMGISTPSGKSEWKIQNVSDLIKNPVYAGYVRTHNWKEQKKIVNGEVVKRRVKCSDDEKIIVKGLHEPLVSEETFRKANDILALKCACMPKKYVMQNPFSSLLRCSSCGHVMSGTQYHYDHGGFLYCPNCKSNVGATIPEVETAVIKSLKAWIKELPAEPKESNSGNQAAQFEKLVSQRKIDVEKLESQMQRAYELVEQGVYTIDVFQDRIKQLKEKHAAAEKALKEAKKQADSYTAAEKAKKEMLPKAKSVLEAYESAQTAEEKNKLLRSILSRIDYKKTRHARCLEGSDLSLILYPLFPV